MKKHDPYTSLAIIDEETLYCYPCARLRFGDNPIQDLIDDTDFASNGRGGYLGGVMRCDLTEEDTCSTCGISFLTTEEEVTR